MAETNLTALREAAEAATPGPWHNNFGYIETEPFGEGDGFNMVADTAHIGAEADSEYVAAFDPPTVLALIDRVEAAEAAVAALVVGLAQARQT